MNFWRYLVPYSKQKASEIHRAIVRMVGLEPQFSKRNYETFSKEGFNANVWVNRCIGAIADGAASVDWLLYQKDSNGKRKELENHPLLDLINNPNEMTSRAELIEQLVVFSNIAGNAYLDMVGPNDPKAPPRELWVLRPDRMQVVPDRQNYVRGYQYQLGSEAIFLDAKRVAHFKTFNPIDDFYGLAQTEVAGRGIDNDNAANAWNNSLLNNGGRPSGALTTEETLTETQYDNLSNTLNASVKGAANAGKPLLLEGGLKWQEMSLSPRDMDFIQSKKMSILEICAAYRVPPEVVGYGETKTYSNYQEARRALYEDAVIPNLNRIRDKLNLTLVKKFGDNLYLDYNKDNIEPLQENHDAVYSRAGKAYKDGLLMKNEARLKMGYEAVDGGDEFYTAPTPMGMGEDPEKPGKEEEEKHFFIKKALNLNDEEKTLYWRSMERRRAAFYKRVEGKVADYFKTEQKAIVEAFKAGGLSLANRTVDKGKKDLSKLLAEVNLEVIQVFGTGIFNTLKNDLTGLETKVDIPLETGFDVFDEAVQDYISEFVALKVVLVTTTTKDQIRQLIAGGEEQGWGIPEMAEAIDTLYLDQIIKNRSVVIARTEVIGASNAGSRFAAQQTGLDLQKEWIATRDDRTRDTHKDLDGQKREMDDNYSNGLMFPGDPSGKAKEVIQCRCTEGYVVKD